MCKRRFFNCSNFRFSIVVEVSYPGRKRNGLYEMCIHRYYSSCKFL